MKYATKTLGVATKYEQQYHHHHHHGMACKLFAVLLNKLDEEEELPKWLFYYILGGPGQARTRKRGKR